MVARNEVGIDPRAVLDYTGAQFSFLPCFQAPRRPTITDIRPQFSLWRVGTNSPSQVLLNGVVGEFWYLSYFNTLGQAIWLPLSSGTSGGILNIPVPFGTSPVFPNGLGSLSFTSSLGTVIITGSANNIDFNVVTGTSAIDKVAVDASTPPGTNPVLPFGNQITIEGGATFATGTRAFPILTNSLAANTIDLQIQLSGSNAAVSTPNNFGVSQFDANQFIVVGGFVQLRGAGPNPAITKVAVQTGTSPIVPTFAGIINFNGAVVAAGTNPVRTDGTGANTVALEVQISQAIAATDVTKIGLSAFNSAEFTVDANGFVGLLGTAVGQTITGQSGGALSPTAGNWNIFGASTAAGTNPVVTSGAGSTLTVNVQKSQAIAATDATKVGLAAFNSAQFTVDANGFVSIAAGTTVLETLTGNTGGAISPIAGNINTIGAGSITVAGAGNTLTAQLQGLTQYDLLVGQGTTTIGLITPSATSGIPLISQGAAAYPIFGTAVVAGGGTGDISFTPYAVITGGTTATGPLQNVVGVGTAGQVLTSAGAGALPTWAAGGVGSLLINMDAGTSPITPTANTLIFTGAQVATGVVGTNVIRTDGSAANAMTIQIQRATTAAVSTIADNGVAHFNSADFSVDANGFVSSLSTGLVNTLTGNTGGPISPISGNINTIGTGSITIAGAGNTLTAQLTGLTAHNVLVGEGTATIGLIAPSATSGIPLISQGAASDPLFGTAVVAGGGTGNTTFTAYSVITAGTTATGPFQNVVGLGSSGQVLTSTGAGALPTWQAVGASSLLITLDAGTTPISPIANTFIFTGAQVATGVVGTNVIRTDGTAANQMTIQIQRSTVAATSNLADNGVSHFSSANFSVDSNGFVTSNAVTINTAGNITGGGTVNLGGTITLTGTAVSFVWTDEAVSFAAVSNNGYFCTAVLTASLPAAPAQGDIVRVVVDTTSIVTIKANTGQFIRLGNVISSSAGTAASTRQGDAMDLVYRTASATWYNFDAPVGTWLIT